MGISGLRLIPLGSKRTCSNFRTSESTGTQDVTLANTALKSGKLQFEFNTQTGKSYVVQFTAALASGNWQTLTTLTGDGARKTVSETVTGTQRFYRVSVQ